MVNANLTSEYLRAGWTSGRKWAQERGHKSVGDSAGHDRNAYVTFHIIISIVNAKGDFLKPLLSAP